MGRKRKGFRWLLLVPLLLGANPAQGPEVGGVLTAARGSVSGHSAHGVDGGAHWWTFTAPVDGWYRFEARGDGSAHAVTLTDAGTGTLVSSSRWRDEGGALLHMKAGSSHRVSVVPIAGGGDFRLGWAREAAPVRLRLAGRLADGGLDARGVPVEIRRPGELAFGGGRLYMASGLGLTVFERDAATGALAVVGHVDADLAAASLAWDGERGRVLAHDCGTWLSFPVDGGGAEDMPVSGDPAGCGRLLLDAEGGLVHRVGDAGVDTFSVGEDGALRFEGTVSMWGMRGAVVGGPGRVYAVGDDGLAAIERDRRTGRFAATRTGVALVGAPLAFDAEGERVLAAGSAGMQWFALESEAAPARPPAPDVPGNGLDGCAFAVLGAGPTVDAFCAGVALSSLRGGRAHAVATLEGEPAGAVASPDGQHVYVGTRSGELLTFARVASASDDHGDGLSTATAVAIPSTTAGEIGVSGEADFFRVEVGIPGTLTFETTGTTNTYAFLYADTDRPLRFNDDGGEGGNFRIATGVGRYPELSAGVYHVGVWGYTTGAYELVVSGTARGAGALAAASAPSVSVNAVAAGDEGTPVTLGATLSGGTYDGTPEYDWDVSGGVLDDDTSATPEWTRPSVSADTSHTVSLTVTVRGTGTNARDGTSDTASASVAAPVRDVPQLPVADAPSVSIHAVPDGDEGTATTLGATLTGGAYDGALEYAWTVSGGQLDNAASATPAWTRPSVSVDTSYTVELTVTARGTGTVARAGTSDTESAGVAALVRDTTAALPVASAPTVTIDAVADGDEGTKATLGASLAGGSYDGTPEYDWDVNGGTLDDDTLAAPEWTRPAVTSNTNFTVGLTVTVHGTGTSAQTGTSATANASRAALVLDVAAPACVDDAKWKTVADYYDHNATRSPNYGANWYRVLIAYRLEDPERALPTWEGATSQPTTRYTASEATDGESVWSGWTPVREVLECLEKAFPTLPAAVAPAVAIDAVAAGDEGTRATLGATLTGGTYDGAVEYAWSVSGGALDDATLATPEWTRPTVNADGDYTVGLTVTVHGTGTNALNGSSATASASVEAEVRDVPPQLPAADAPAVSINAVADGDEGTTVTLGATLVGGAYDGTPEYDWDVSGGALDNDNLAAPTWTRPAVTSDTGHTVGLTVTVRGAGTNVRNGTSATANASLAAQVLDVAPPASSCVDDAKWKTVADYYDRNATRSPNYGANWYRVLIAYRLEDPERALPTWEGSTAQPTARYTAAEATGGESVWSGWTPVRKALECLEKTFPTLPAAVAPTVAINAVAAGDEGAKATLGASLAGGTYDSTPEYAWTVTGGALDDPASATPEWTRPRVDADGDHTVSLTVTVHGAGTNVLAGSSATANASLDTLVRDLGAVSIDYIPAGDEDSDVQLGATLTGLTGTPTYAWSVDGGMLDDPASATPTWTRPSVSDHTRFTVTLDVTANVVDSRTRKAWVRNTGRDHSDSRRKVRNFRLVDAATPVSIPDRVDGIFGPPLWDRDYFRFSIPSERHVSIYTISNGLSKGTLINTEDGHHVRSSKFNGPGSNFRIVHRLAAGDYWLLVEGYENGVPYTLVLEDLGTTPTKACVSDANWNTVASSYVADSTRAPHYGAAWYRLLISYQRQRTDKALPDWASRVVPLPTAPHTVASFLKEDADDWHRYFHEWLRIERILKCLEAGRPFGDAQAPIVSIDTVSEAEEGVSVRLGTTRTGGIYDGEIEFAWQVDGGALDDATSARPVWTLPSVTADTSYTVGLTITVQGTGTIAQSGSSDTASASHPVLVRQATSSLPAADAPSISINAIPAANERTKVGLSATLSGGAYDGSLEYAWTVTGGTLDDATSATPTWTRPSVNVNANYIVYLIITARGTGTVARNGTSDTSRTSRTAIVQNIELPVADAPGVSINAIPAGVEGTTVQLGATLSGGTYDGSPEYDWSVTGGALDDSTSAAPTWTRPAVNADTNFTVQLTITARGTGGKARKGSSDTANASRTALIQGNGVPLPAASAPAVSIDVIADGDEGTTAPLAATLTGGTYDGTPEYAWTVSGGRLDDAASATPTWTRPSVTAHTSHTVGLTVTVHGAGTRASTGSSATAKANRSALARDSNTPAPQTTCVDDDRWKRIVRFYNHNATLPPGYGANWYRVLIAYQGEDPERTLPTWKGSTAQPTTPYTADEAASNESTWSGWTSVREVLDCLEEMSTALPVAAAPTLAINPVQAGNENTQQQLGATLTGGAYDGSLEYAWQVDGGALDDPASATPTWTRPTVTADDNIEIRLTVTARGAGVNASVGSSDTADASHTALVRNTAP